MWVGIPHRRASQVHEGGWIRVPAKGEGRVASLRSVPGCRMLTITLDNGWQFQVPIAAQVEFYP